MAIVKMKRLRLLALAADRDELLQRLLRAGCVEITEPDVELADSEWAALVQRDHAMVGSVKSKLASVNTALDTLKKYAPAKSGLFILRKNIDESKFCNPEVRSAMLEKAAEINECSRQVGQLTSLSNRLASNRLGLLPWSALDIDLNLRQIAAARLVFGVCPAAMSLDELKQKLSEETPAAECIPASSDREQHYMLIVCHKEEEDRVMEALRPFAFNPSPLKDVQGSAAENIAALDRQLAELEEKRRQLGEKIASFAEVREDLKICADQMVQELAKEEVRNRLVTTGTLVFLKGWVPAPDIKKLEQELEGFDCAVEYIDPVEEDTPPTELRNSKLIHSMEMVTEMYSLPAYRGIDPNPLIFPFFTMFFGLMYADVAYGLALIIISRIIAHKYHPKGTLGNIMQLTTICGVTATFWGVLSGSIFGDAISVVAKYFLGIEDFVLYVPVINPLQNPMQVLYMALIIGVIQLMCGMCIKIYLCFRDGHPLDALYDVGSWWLVFAGIAVLVLKHTPVVLYMGAAALVLTQGRSKKSIVGKFLGGIASLYNITSWLGDILSYTRLMALMLAGTVIASVVNILGTLPGNIFAFALIFIIGHSFNMGINIIGTFVHGARLQYLEYFSKFYEEGGIPFRPLRYNTKYVDIVAKGESE